MRRRGGRPCEYRSRLSFLDFMKTPTSATNLHSRIQVHLVGTTLSEAAIALWGFALAVSGTMTTRRAVNSRVFRGEPGRLAKVNNVDGRWGLNSL